jgi:hypothetical protein
MHTSSILLCIACIVVGLRAQFIDYESCSANGFGCDVIKSTHSVLISYTAIDQEACKVHYSTASKLEYGNTFTTFSDGGGGALRTAYLNRLLPDTTYYIQICCNKACNKIFSVKTRAT